MGDGRSDDAADLHYDRHSENGERAGPDDPGYSISRHWLALPGLRRTWQAGVGLREPAGIPLKTRNAPRADDQMRLGGSNDPLEPFLQKQRGMHWRTYRRLRSTPRP